MHRALVLLAFVTSTTALAVPPKQDVQLWGLLTATGKPTDRLRLYGELQPRYDFATSAVERLLVRAAVGYQFTPSFSLWAGHGWTPLLSPRYADEQRPFLQALYATGTDSIRIQSRTRFEARFISGASGPSLRARSMLRGVVPLGDSGFSLAAYDELFVNANTVTGGPTAGMDQNRLFGGANYEVSSSVLVEAGYLFNFIWRPTAPNNRVIHAIVTQLAFNF